MYYYLLVEDKEQGTSCLFSNWGYLLVHFRRAKERKKERKKERGM